MCHASVRENGSGRRDQNAAWSGSRAVSSPRRVGTLCPALAIEGVAVAARRPAARARRLMRAANTAIPDRDEDITAVHVDLDHPLNVW